MTQRPQPHEIDDATMQYYLRKGRLERSIAVHDAFRGACRWVRYTLLNHFGGHGGQARGCGSAAAG